MNALKSYNLKWMVLAVFCSIMGQSVSGRAMLFSSSKKTAKLSKKGKRHKGVTQQTTQLSQSPINLSPEFALKTNLKDVEFNYDSTASLHFGTSGKRLRKEGRSVVLHVLGNNFIIVDGKRFSLKYVDIKTPSEHVFGWKHFPVELQFVHKNSDGECVVLSVFLQAGKQYGEAQHKKTRRSVFDTLIGAMLSGSPRVDRVALRNLFPKRSAYYRYEGSLTTKPYSPTLWFVYTDPVAVSVEQVWNIEDVVGGKNNHPVQLPGKRAVYLDTAVDH